jgi:hypothetical protein
MDGGDDSAQGFSSSVHFCIPLLPVVTCQPKSLVTDESCHSGYHYQHCWRGNCNSSREMWKGSVYGTSFHNLSIGIHTSF